MNSIFEFSGVIEYFSLAPGAELAEPASPVTALGASDAGFEQAEIVNTATKIVIAKRGRVMRFLLNYSDFVDSSETLPCTLKPRKTAREIETNPRQILADNATVWSWPNSKQPRVPLAIFHPVVWSDLRGKMWFIGASGLLDR
jgi:hypothetical protein